MYDIQYRYCFICHPTDSTVPEDAEIEPRTVATTALTVRCSNYLARSHSQYIIVKIGKAGDRRSLQSSKREHPALQNMKFFYFFLYLWVIFALLDLDLDPHSKRGSGSGSSPSN
jgi:hypothetical protein